MQYTKIFLLTLLLSVSSFAKNISICVHDKHDGREASLTGCYLISTNGEWLDLNIKNIGKMYKKGWRLLLITNKNPTPKGQVLRTP